MDHSTNYPSNIIQLSLFASIHVLYHIIYLYNSIYNIIHLDKSPLFLQPLQPRVRKSNNGIDIVVLRRGDVIDFHCVLAPWDALQKTGPWRWVNPWLIVVNGGIFHD